MIDYTPQTARRRATWERAAIHGLVNFGEHQTDRPKISIIVPVCNVEDYLAECLESIIAQTMEDFEAICVNDGSSDSSLDILRDFAARDSRIKVVDKDNAGYGHAMNIGMDLAQGDYIAIVESDDWIRPAMLETLYNAITENDLDLVKSDFYRFASVAGATRLFYHAIGAKNDLYNRVMRPSESRDLFRFTNTWTGLYRRAYLEARDIRHQESPGASFQDNGFWFQTTCAAERIMYLETPFYMNRRDRAGSSVFSDGKLYAGNSEFAFAGDFLERNADLGAAFAGMLVKKKWDTYFYNYKRVGADRKLEYAQVCSSEMREAIERGYLDEADFSQRDLERIHQLAFDVEAFHESFKGMTLRQFSGALAEGAVPIVFVSDDAYALPTATAITSVIRSRRKSTKYHVVVVGLGLTDDTVKRIASLGTPTTTIEILAVREHTLDELHPTELTDFGVPSSALAKFLLPTLLPEIDKVLYLDGDIIVRHDLKELYSTNLEGKYAGVVSDIPQVLYERQTFGSDYGRTYFNSGVMLLNLERLRDERLEDVLIQTKRILDSPLMDQDVFNEVFGTDVVQLPIRYNTLLVNLVRSERRFRIEDINSRYGTSYGSIEDIRQDSAVIHFCSKDKPWKYYDVPMADEWAAAFAASPFADVHLRRISILNKVEDPAGNGLYETIDRTESQRTAVATSVDGVNYTLVGALTRQIASVCAVDDRVVVNVLHSSLTAGQIEWLERLGSPKVEVRPIDIRRILTRDSTYLRKGRLPEGYARLVVPEVLMEYSRVLYMGHLPVVGALSSTLTSIGDDVPVSIALLDDGGRRFFSSAAVLYDVHKTLVCGLKSDFFKRFDRAQVGKRSFAGAMRDALQSCGMTALDCSALDVSAHNRSVSAREIGSRYMSGPAAPYGRPLNMPTTGHQGNLVGAEPGSRQHKRTYEDGIAHVRASRQYRIGRLFTMFPGAVRRRIRAGRR